MSKDGNIKTETEIFYDSNSLVKIAFSKQKTNSRDCFLFHKTTQRKLYDDEYKKHSRNGFFDVIFTNEKGQVTEGAISNIFIKSNGVLYTPPVSCGLLDGTFRRHLLENRRIPVKEKILYKDDIIKADKIYLTNSVRGIVEAMLK